MTNLKDIALVVFDFDGVMTDNRVYVSGSGEEMVVCNRSDSWGLKAMREAGIPMLVLSTEEHPVVAVRCTKLKLPCHQGVGDKGKYLADFLKKEKIDPKHVAYVGNDTNDLPCLKLVGLPVVVGDAHPDVVPFAKVILEHHGGHGAVREFCDMILNAHA